MVGQFSRRAGPSSPTVRHSQEAADRIAEAQREPDLIEAHVAEHIGPIATVLHEIVSQSVHLDILRIDPTAKRPFTTLVTMGMSDLPMAVPEPRINQHMRFAELMLCLPPDWPVDLETLTEERHFWPYRLLKDLARLPHVYDSWLWLGHSVPNGKPARPYAAGTALCGAVLLPPTTAPTGFRLLDAGNGKEISFHAVFPVTGAEMALKLKDGAEALARRLAKAGVTEIVAPGRACVADGSGLGRRLLRLFGRS